MPDKKQIACFLDYDNIKINMKTEPPEKLSEELGYRRLKSWMLNVGEVVAAFVFAPAVTISANVEFFYRLGFIPIACPMIPQVGKEKRVLYGIEKETDEMFPLINKTDEVLISVANMIINIAPEITHICIASGDHHFIPVARLAREKGKKVMIAFSNFRPSRDLVRFASKDGPNVASARMLHHFNPIRD